MTNNLSSVLAECLDAIEQHGLSIEECAARHPDQREALLRLLPLAVTLGTAPVVEPSPEFQAKARRRLLARLPARQTAAAQPSGLWAAVQEWFVPRQRMLARVLIIALAVLVLGASVVAASAQSFPNDWLYPVKMAVEQIRVALAATDMQRGELHLRFATERLTEVQRLIEIGRGADAALAVDNLAAQIQAAAQDASAVPNPAGLHDQLNETIDQCERFLAQTVDQLPSSAQATVQRTRDLLSALQRQGSPPPASNPLPQPTPTRTPPPATPTPIPTDAPPTRQSPRPTVTQPAVRPTMISTPWITRTPHLPPTFAPTIRVTMPFPWPTFTPPTFMPTIRATVFTPPTFKPPTSKPPTFKPPMIKPPTIRPPTYAVPLPTFPATPSGHWPFAPPTLFSPTGLRPH